VIVLVTTLLLGGCSTIGDTFHGSSSKEYLGREGPNVMGGLRLDAAHLSKDSGCRRMEAPIHFLDVPFSLALDLVFLPFTVPYTIFRAGPPETGHPAPAGDKAPLQEQPTDK